MNTPTSPVHLVRRQPTAAAMPSVAITPDIADLLERNAVVAVGVSGGKDSQAAAIAAAAYLKEIRHTGPKILVHSDLGRVEWQDSLPTCERLADYLGWELMTVRRNAGDMMDRWQTRWHNNLARYVDMSCVKLILPWSTPSMRFCTSELKIDVICSALKKRFPGQDIVNVSGIRREESAARMKMPVSAPMKKLARYGSVGYAWNLILDWKIGEVFSSIERSGLKLHEAYTKYNASRVSCVYCIMSASADLHAASGCADNQDVLIEMVELEAASTFAFQGHRWLADTAPHLLPLELRERVALAKEGSIIRQNAEAQLPTHLLYAKGWPTTMPTTAEARLIAEVRMSVARAVNIKVNYTEPGAILARYEGLLLTRAEKEGTIHPTPSAAMPGDDSDDDAEESAMSCGLSA